VAARLAADGLTWWIDAIELLVRHEGAYPRDDTYDIRMAMDLATVRGFLTTDWWEANRVGLLGVASPAQWAALSAAAKASYGVLSQLASIGDVGREVWRKRARAVARQRRERRQPASRSEEELHTSPPSTSGDQASEDDDWLNRQEAQLEALSNEIEAGLAAMGPLIDARLWMVRDIQATVTRAGPKFRDAARVCQILERKNKGPFGLAGRIRRS
jgi:hypothetical protein